MTFQLCLIELPKTILYLVQIRSISDTQCTCWSRFIRCVLSFDIKLGFACDADQVDRGQTSFAADYLHFYKLRISES